MKSKKLLGRIFLSLFRRLILKPETLIEVPWEIDASRDKFPMGQPVVTQGYLRLQKCRRKSLMGTSLADVVLFAFSDGKKEWLLADNEVYWDVPEFAEWKPEE
jgi:hypothetical protein